MAGDYGNVSTLYADTIARFSCRFSSRTERPMDFQQDFNVKLAGENQQLRCDVECLKKHLEMRDKEQNLLNRQINGLKEDNTRIAKMY